MPKLKEWPIVSQLFDLSKRIKVPGFKGMSVYEIISFVIEEASNDAIYTRANSVAFSFFMSIFPTIIVLFTLIPFLPGTQNFVEVISDSTSDILPQNAHQYIFEIVDGVANTERGGLRWLGAILALFFASSGMLTLMNGFDKNYKVFKSRGFFLKRIIAVYLTLLMTILFIFSFVLIVLGKQFIGLGIEYFGLQSYASTTFLIARVLGIITIFYLGITLIYRLGPSLLTKVPFWNPGAILATGFSLLSSFGFAFFVNNFGRYNEIYGSIGALIVIMIWLQINAYIIVVGFELNASIAVHQAKVEESRIQA